MRDANHTKQTIILATVFCAFAVAVALGIDTDEIRMPKDGFTVQDIRFDPSKAEVIEGISQSVNTSRRSKNLLVTEFGIAGALDEPPYEYTLVESDAERPPIHHYRLNDAVTRTTDTLTIKDEGIGDPDLGLFDLTSVTKSDEWTTDSLLQAGYDTINTPSNGAYAATRYTISIGDIHTFCAWIYIPEDAVSSVSTSRGEGVVFGFVGGPGSWITVWRYGTQLYVSNNIVVVPYPITAGEWHHVVMIHDRYSSTGIRWTIYVDSGYVGVSVGTGTYSQPWIGLARNNVSSAGSPYSIIDDARIYDYALSPEQIERLYNSGLGTEQSITTGTQVLRDSIIYGSGGRTYVGTAMPGGAGEIQFATSATTRAVLDNDALTMSVPIVGDLTGHADTATTATVALSSADYTTPTLTDVLDAGPSAGFRDVTDVGNLTAFNFYGLLSDLGRLIVQGPTRLNTGTGERPVAIERATYHATSNPLTLALDVLQGGVRVAAGGLTVSDGIEATTATIGAVNATTVNAGSGGVLSEGDISSDAGLVAGTDATVGRDLNVTSDTVIGGTLGVTGNLTAPNVYTKTQVDTALGAKVPYTGATTNVNIGSYGLTATDVTDTGNTTVAGRLTVGGSIVADSIKDVSQQGLVLAMPFNTASITGTVALDSSTYANHGTISGATPVATGGFNGGGYLSFDGTDDYVSIPDSSTLDLEDAHTVSIWLSISAKPVGQSVIVGKTNLSSGAGGWGLIFNGAGTYGKIQYALFDGSVPSPTYTVPADTLNVGGSWNLITVTKDVAGSTTVGCIKTYINGVVVAGDPAIGTNGEENYGTNTYLNALNVSIGASYNGLSPLPYNAVDDVRIYNRALSTSEVKALYDSRFEVPMPKLALYSNTVQKVYSPVNFQGAITATSYHDNTPGWDKSPDEALAAIVGVKSKDVMLGKVKIGSEIDHDSLPPLARAVIGSEQVKTGKQIEQIIDTEKGKQTIMVDEYTTQPVYGRDLGAMITIQAEAIKALEARLKKLEGGKAN